MTQKLSAALIAALLMCAGAGAVFAQDQPSSNPPASDTSKPEMGKKKGSMKEHGMDACKDDVAKFCADAKTHKEKHECLEKHEDELSPACKKHHEKMEKKWKKGHKGMKDKDEKMEKSEKPMGGDTKPSNP